MVTYDSFVFGLPDSSPPLRLIRNFLFILKFDDSLTFFFHLLYYTKETPSVNRRLVHQNQTSPDDPRKSWKSRTSRPSRRNYLSLLLIRDIRRRWREKEQKEGMSFSRLRYSFRCHWFRATGTTGGWRVWRVDPNSSFRFPKTLPRVSVVDQ